MYVFQFIAFFFLVASCADWGAGKQKTVQEHQIRWKRHIKASAPRTQHLTRFRCDGIVKQRTDHLHSWNKREECFHRRHATKLQKENSSTAVYAAQRAHMCVKQTQKVQQFTMQQTPSSQKKKRFGSIQVLSFGSSRRCTISAAPLPYRMKTHSLKRCRRPDITTAKHGSRSQPHRHKWEHHRA